MTTIYGPTIFKRDTNGQIRVWRYLIEGPRWTSESGIENGGLVTAGWTTCTPRSRDTAEAQALFEAEAEMGKKLERDYALTRGAVDDVRAFGGPVMLAYTYDGAKPPKGPLFSQPKLDGIRCKINRFGMWSRNGKPILGAPHIFASLGRVFAENPPLELDGELYNHELHDDFNRISSLVRKQKPTDEQIAEAARFVQYHIYDLPSSSSSFEKRDRMLDLFVNDHGDPMIQKVVTTPITSPEQIDAAYASYLEDGYEGQIIRLDAPYEGKRSKNLLKRKEFITDEFELVRIEEGNGNWSGLAKRVVFKIKDGRECGGGIRGNREAMLALLGRAESLVGKQVTVRYFTPTPDGMPRFPVAIDFDRPDQISS